LLSERAYRLTLRFDFFAFRFFVFFAALRFFEAFFGTFLPLALASDSPIAIACLRLLTFLPERPLFSVPALRFFIARLTSVDAFFEYLRAIAFLRLSSVWQKSNHRWHTKFLIRHSPLALTGDGRHFGRRGTSETPTRKTAPSPVRTPHREDSMTLTKSHVAGPTMPAVREMTFGDLLRKAAEAAPDRLALIAGVPDPKLRRQWTYAQLYREAQRTARALLSRFKPGERIAVWAQNIPEWVMLEFGAGMAGMILVTVNPAFRAREVEYVLKQSRSAGVFVVNGFRGNPMLDTVQAVAANCPELREIICFDDWDAFIAAGDDESVKLPAVSPDDPVMIQYTSGTTGFPKGALLRHRGLLNNGADTADRMGVDPGDVFVTTMPLFHTGGCVCCVIGAVSKAATQVLIEAFEPGLVLEMLGTYRGNAMLGVPTMLVAMLEHPTFPATDLSSVKAICSGGSTVPAALVRLLEEKLGAPFTIVFGQTECSPVAAQTRTTDSVEDKANTIGLPLPNMENKIIDPNTGETVPVGTVGEFCTRGYHVMIGYFEMPDATAAAIDADGWLHSGDLCAMDARGYCTVEGRLKDMIIRGGENIYPRELEELLFKHPKVGEVAVIGVPHEKWGEEVAAFIRPAPGATIEKEELIDYMRASLAPHKTPKHWFVVEAFPLTGSGKIQKFKLREAWTKGEMTAI
jgi:fatty-acyl-CoA synthase